MLGTKVRHTGNAVFSPAYRSHSHRAPATLLVTACCVLTLFSQACRPRLPASHADPGEEARVDWQDPLANHPVHRRVRTLRMACHERVVAVHRQSDARNSDNWLYVALAWAAYLLARSMFSLEDPMTGEEAALTGPGGSLDYRCTPTPGDNPSHGGCNATLMPTATVDGDGIIQTNRPVDEAWAPTRRIETVNGAVDAMDDFLFSHPDPAEWTAEQTEAFERLASALESVCVD